MFLNTNIAAMSSQRHVYQTNLDLDKSIERLSSGLKINSAADDASGLAIAEKMYAQRSGLSTAIQNTQDTSALFKIAEGALNQVGKMLNRVEELAVRAANQTLTSSDRASIANEIKELTNQIDSISENTEYNTMKLLNQNLDVKKSMTMTGGSGAAGSVKILSTPDTLKNATGLLVTVVAVASAAVIEGTAATAATMGTNSVITINNVDISVLSTDTTDTVVAKINAANAKTGVIATQDIAGSAGGALVTLVTGKIDADATNVAVLSAAGVVNGSALGYTTVGSAARIVISGDNTIMSNLGFAAGSAVGTNAQVQINDVDMTADGTQGNVLEMKNMGSKAYGLKIGTDMFNGAYGGVVLTLQGAAASAIFHTSDYSGADEATVDIDINSRLRIQVGANYDQALNYSIGATDSRSIGVGASSKFGSLADIQVDTATNANISLKVVQQAIKDVASVRSQMGAVLNRLDYTDKTLQVQRENMAAAESKIRDADISLEMTNFTKQQILMQAGTSMLAQANSKPQSILQLLK